MAEERKKIWDVDTIPTLEGQHKVPLGVGGDTAYTATIEQISNYVIASGGGGSGGLGEQDEDVIAAALNDLNARLKIQEQNKIKIVEFDTLQEYRDLVDKDPDTWYCIKNIDEDAEAEEI